MPEKTLKNLFPYSLLPLLPSKKAAFTLAEGAKPHSLFEGYRKVAFTLAEVLITLGIIGVVAVLTLPPLIQNYEKQVTVSKLKKTYTILSQALSLSIAENGPVETWTYKLSEEAIAEKYLYPYLNVKKKGSCYKPITPSGARDYVLVQCLHSMGDFFRQLDDGTSIWINNKFPGMGYDWSMNYALYITVDINGKKGPNRVGRDVFSFAIASKSSDKKNRVLNTILPAKYHVVNPTCPGKSNAGDGYLGMTCTSMIMKAGWKIPDDYGWW